MRRRESMYTKYIKQFFDLFFATLFIILLSPLLSIVFIILLLTTKDSPIYKQDRVGQYGKIFKIYKFRTLPKNTPILVGQARVKIRNRVSPFARFLRNTSIDELPQLWNVLQGDMSIIGPRPVVPQEAKLVALRTASGAINVKPGITGLAQVKGRKKLNDRQKADYDAIYSQRISAKEDLLILILTLPIIVERDGMKKFFQKKH